MEKLQQPEALPKVLCIDDTPETCVLIRRLLSSHFVVLEAGDGLQGIELAVEAEPDLILVDLHMPHLSGYEVATRLKSLMPKVPVVALTADVMAHVRERALASGCDGYLSKPIDPDRFLDQVQAFMSGEREELEDDSYRRAYQEALVARFEEKVRELTRALERNAELNEQNTRLLEKARRQAKLLEAGARVGRNITSILDLDRLLSTTADVICDEFSLPYVGVYLIDESGEWAVLQAGRGEAGEALLAQGHKLRVGGTSTIGAAIGRRKALVALGARARPDDSGKLHLPRTRSEVALPLMVGDSLIGALTVQSDEENAFSEDDVTALQAMADQLAIAINNARLLKDLEVAHQQLVQTKTFQVIAAATGEAIHWVGNKAAPIPGSAARITEDLVRYLVVANALLEEAPVALREHKFARLLTEAAEEIVSRGSFVKEIQAELETLPLERLRRTLDVESIFEDLEIIETSARAILNIKEDLIGPARQQKLEVISLPELLEATVASMGIPDGIVRTLFAGDLLPVRADGTQLSRVFVNLIKNALEAMEKIRDKKLFIWARRADEPGLVVVEVTDNGVGIPPEETDNVWMPFYTTKGSRGGTGLGLPACAQIVGQLGGRITVESDVGLGTTFSVFLPAVEQ
jgi:signal transduction histidine kinase/DNA-binding response OmpR family regulator